MQHKFSILRHHNFEVTNMKARRILALTILLLTVLSFCPVCAKGAVKYLTPDSITMEQIKAKKLIAREHMKSNLKLEKQVRKKQQQIKKLLTALYEDETITQTQIEQKIKPKIASINNKFNEASKIQTVIWKQLNMFRDNMEAKNLSAAIKNIDNAANLMEKKHNILIDLDSDLDKFLDFLKSFEYK